MKLTAKQIKSTLLNIDGSEIKTRIDGEMKPLTFKRAIQIALDADVGEKEANEGKLTGFLLASLLEFEQDCELTSEQIKLALDRTKKVWPATIYGRIMQILEPVSVKIPTHQLLKEQAETNGERAKAEEEKVSG